MTVTFFGHRDAPSTIKETLKAILVSLIENEHATVFYFGNHGNFYFMVKYVLTELNKKYKTLDLTMVLAYMPKKEALLYNDHYSTLLPFEATETIPRFAISARNKWMIENSELIITYVKHKFGGAYKFKCVAQKMKKRVLEISDITQKTDVAAN